ncbi:unnamed protein product [Porites evermanni]|uniref:L1 transposable element RRM domain-containing protein n=1 Tax=Porites evermanni TaxID=104178 RepID=A0ABN8MMC5_9CNID|nr:unnamed protein product [Porites evermanni]
MAEFFNNLLSKRAFRSSDSSDDSTTSPEAKKPKKYDSPLTEGPEQEEDEVMAALNMSEEVAAKVQKILEKLEKLDTIELSLKKIESKLAKLETRTTELEAFKEEAKKDISELKDGANFASKQLQEKSQELTKAQAEITELTRKVQKHEEAVKETESKCLYLEAYSRRENIKFMNIEEGPQDQPEDTEEILRDFLERELGYVDAQSVEFQRVHRTGKTKDGNPRPILARFLRYKDVQNIFSLGHRLKGSKFQMFRDLPTEIVKRRRVQMETFKTAKRRGIPAAFSQAQPDKLYIRGRLWPVGKELPS